MNAKTKRKGKHGETMQASSVREKKIYIDQNK